MRFRSDKTKNYALACVHKDNRKFIVICVCLLSVFTVLAYLFPYTGDDWSWGSNIGTRRLESFFDNYNGRYLGNLLVLALTRSRMLRAAVVSLTSFFCCVVSCKYSQGKREISLLFSVILFFAMPKVIFTQAVVWTSGFANYVPSALMSVMYILFVKNIMYDEMPKYPRFMFLFMFGLGFCAALFMENITVFNIILAVFVLVYSIVKFKRMFSAHIGFLVGSVLGAVCMFSNSVYNTIALGKDGYRTIPKGFFDILKNTFKNIFTICENVAIFNITVCVSVSAILSVLVYFHVKKFKGKANKYVVPAMILNVLCVSAFVLKKILSYPGAYDNSPKDLIVKVAFILLVVLYAFSIVVIVCFCVEKKQRFAILFPFCCIPASVGPLAFVDPIGARCFFISQLLLMLFAVGLFSYMLEETDFKKFNYKLIFSALTAGTVALTALFVMTFIPVYKTEKLRNEFAKIQSDNNENIIIVGKLPANVYIHTPNPHIDAWTIPYKRFYKLNEDAQLKLMEDEDFYEYFNEYVNQNE